MDQSLFYSNRSIYNEQQTQNHTTFTTSDHSEIYYYTYFFCLSKLLVIGLVPLTLLAYYNISLYLNIKSASMDIQNETWRSKSRKKEVRLGRILFGIVVTFIICHSLRIFILFHEMMIVSDKIECTIKGIPRFVLWEAIIHVFNEFLLVVNSSMNTIIYFYFRNKGNKKRTKQMKTESTPPSTKRTFVKLEMMRNT